MIYRLSDEEVRRQEVKKEEGREKERKKEKKERKKGKKRAVARCNGPTARNVESAL